VRHQDPQALLRPLDDADHVARATLRRNREAIMRDGQAGGPERLGHPLVRAPLARPGRGSRSGERERAREQVAGIVGPAHQRERRGGGGEHGRHGNAGASRVARASAGRP
jgi:hypothetical protein